MSRWFGPAPIDGEEELARFLFSRDELNASGAVKQAAYMPRKGAGNLEVSVFRKTKLGRWYPAKKREIVSARGKSLKGVALIKRPQIEGIKIGVLDHLRVEPEESEHRWHANILGWPSARHHQRDYAVALAEASRLELEQSMD